MSSGADLFVVCKTCGSEVSAFVTECPYCGTRLRKRAPKLDRGGAPPRPPPPPAPPRPPPGPAPHRRLRGVGVALASQAGLAALRDVAVFGPLEREWWRVLTAPFAYDNSGYLLCASVGVGLFGWLLERRHGAWAPILVFAA